MTIFGLPGGSRRSDLFSRARLDPLDAPGRENTDLKIFTQIALLASYPPHPIYATYAAHCCKMAAPDACDAGIGRGSSRLRNYLSMRLPYRRPEGSDV